MPHMQTCAHDGANPLMSHDTGIAAHVAIYLHPNVDIWGAYTALVAAPRGGLHVEKIHVALGEIDMLADVHSPWTIPPGRETRVIGDWINQIRQVRVQNAFVVQRTSTNVCMTPD